MFFLSKILEKWRSRGACSDPERGAVDAVCAFADAVSQHYGEEYFVLDGIERQTLSVYVFGAIMTAGVQANLSREEVCRVVLNVLFEYFTYTEDESRVKAEALFDMLNAGPSGPFYPLIRMGGDGFAYWQDGRGPFNSDEFARLLATMRLRSPFGLPVEPV